MKKTHKKVFGIFALAFVVAMTFFAAFLPAPKTQAISSSMVDTINVRVIGGVPDVDAEGIDPGSTFITPKQTVVIPYENVKTVTANVKYTDANGNEYNFDLMTVDVNYAPDTMVIDYDFATGEYDFSYVYYDADDNPQTVTGHGQMEHYGYGNYVFSATGYAGDGSSDDGIIAFGFEPVVADVSSDKETGVVTVDLDYDPDIETGLGTGEVSVLELYIYDEDGNLVADSPITVIPPTRTVDIPFQEYGLGSGNYTLKVIAYNRDGEALYKPFIKPFVYSYGEEEEGGSSIVVPNTGNFLESLNISRTDYLITGLIIFFGVGIGGVMFILKRDKSSRKQKK